MTYILFITLTGAISIIAATLFALKSNWPLGRVLLPLLSVLFFTTACTEYLASFNADVSAKIHWLRLSVALQVILGITLLELTVSFLGKEGMGQRFSIGSRRVHLRFFWRPIAAATVATVYALPWFSLSALQGGDIAVILNRTGELLFAVLFCYHLLTLYIVEKIFRNSTTIQKRVFSLYLASTGIIALGSMVLLVRILFFRTVSFEIVQIHAILCAIFFPGILIGLTRYRLWQEQIVIGRGMVYTSITVLFFGLFLIVLGVIASAVQMLGIRFNEFEAFVVLFSVLFLGILTFFSPHMRKTVTELSRKYLYKEKYDYRDQVLRLHSAHQASGDIASTINAFVDNLRFTIIVKNAFVFLRSSNENFFHRLEEPAAPGWKPSSIRANSPLACLFQDNTVSAIDVDHTAVDTVRQALESESGLIERLSISHLFGIKYSDLLLGILCIDAGKRVFDSEDLMLITMFCESVGTAIFRDRIQRERMEQKQFESFSHMASFIVHDIKNQVATLSLVTKNARDNIGNSDFHPVLLRSLENCSGNLSTLIMKLQSPPRREHLVKQACDCNEIVLAAIEPLRSLLPEGIVIDTRLADIPPVSVDRSALSYILKNLLINAIEALGKKGTITCSTGRLDAMVHDDTYHFSLTLIDRESNSIFITVEDNGPGMSRPFLERRLFKPFNTTKDKGIGIGLYQCKTLIESMGGRLLCWSEEGKGTRFCILL